MENVMTNGFAELSATEMMDVDGGAAKWYDYVIGAGVGGFAIWVYKDLKSVYDYNYIQGRKDSGKM